MSKPTKNAGLICIILTVVTLAGVLMGFLAKNPFIAVLFLAPTVIYEVYRTEGKSTKLSSWIILIALVLEMIFIITKTSFDLAGFLGKSEELIAGYRVPLGDIKIIGPTIMAICSIILFVKTYGIYTKWLAVVIFVSSFAVVYIMDPEIFQDLFRIAVKEGIKQINY